MTGKNSQNHFENAEIGYSKRVLELSNNPENVGRMYLADAEACITGPCGDTMEIYLKIDDRRIIEVKYYTDGCAPSIACGSMITHMATGRTIEEAWQIRPDDILVELDGLPPDNAHCAMLASNTLRRALVNWEGKVNKDWVEMFQDED